MSTPVLQSKTWQYAVNSNIYTPASVADSLAHAAWFIGAFLLGQVAVTDFDHDAIDEADVEGKWELYSSCGSSSGSIVAGAANDGVDRLNLTGTYALADWTRANEGSAHSWYVLRSPAAMGPFYICVNFNGSAANTVSFVVSKNAFSTGGTTTARPTASNEQATVATRAISHLTVITQKRYRATLCTDGNFVIQSSVDGAGLFNFFFAGCTLAETLGADDTHNFWLLNSNATTAAGAPSMADFNSFTNDGVTGRAALGTAITTGAAIERPFAGGVETFASTIPGKDATNNKFRNRQAVICTSNPNSQRGVLVDLTLCPQGTTAWLNGDFVPDSSTGPGEFREFMRAGHMLLPANGIAHVL